MNAIKNQHRHPFHLVCLCTISVVLPPTAWGANRPSEEHVEFFEKRIRPVLVQYCFECHSGTPENPSGLRLDSRGALRRGGKSGPAIVPGKPDADVGS